MAKYLAELDLPYPAAQVTKLSRSEQQTAENLVLHGAPERKLPACIACHGQHMAGMQPAMPGLLTLPADYLSARLGAWRTGQTKAKEPDCMADIAMRLTHDEVSVLAKWLSAQTSSGTKPARRLHRRCPCNVGAMRRDGSTDEKQDGTAPMAAVADGHGGVVCRTHTIGAAG